MSGSVGGIGVPCPRIGASLSIAVSDFVRPNNSPALAACGFVSFIWPKMAPTISTSELPPIFSQMYFQLHSFSRLMSKSFSVRSDRFMWLLFLKAGVRRGPRPALQHSCPGEPFELSSEVAFDIGSEELANTVAARFQPLFSSGAILGDHVG